jgi:NhaP-type Na+/H+ or K+/H+ antiporter
MAIALAASAQSGNAWLGEWLVYDLLYRLTIGLVFGYVLGLMIVYLFFKLPEKYKILKVREGLVAISSTLLIYGLTELAHGYGFLAVFVAAVTIRNYELKHHYHATLHSFTDQVERALLGVVLVLFGGSLVSGILDPLTWEMALLGLTFVLILRPLSGIIGLIGSGMDLSHKLAISFFGIRGVGSFFYLSFGLNHAQFNKAEELWALTAFIVLVSIVLHGLTAPSIMRYVKR